MEDSTDTILRELKNAQGSPQNIGGYYKPDSTLIANVMRPSSTLNNILEENL